MHGGAPGPDSLARMQKVSDWLERMGWRGVPRRAYVMLDERPIAKDAASVHGDMIRYRACAREARAEEAASREP